MRNGFLLKLRPGCAGEYRVRHAAIQADVLRALRNAGVTDYTRVDNAATDDALLGEIFYETLRNLFCESGREMEIMMRMPKEIVYDFNPVYAINDQYNIMPIPADEFDNNALLQEQNPGYSKD